MNSEEYIRDVVLRTCSGSGTNFDQWISELTTLNEQTGGKASSLILAGFGCGGEGGEIADEIKKLAFHGKAYTPEVQEKLKKELGDLLWYAGVLCYVLDENFENIMQLNREKLELRFPNGFTTEASEARVDTIPNSRPKI